MPVKRCALVSLSIAVVTALALVLLMQLTQRTAYAAGGSDGSLQVIRGGKPAGFCPLRHTDVKADISGFIARVIVTQEFSNSSAEKIEAIYTFPLPQDAAVDDMTIQIGGRTIRGVVKRREEAAVIYAKAIAQGQTAALLDQERPNIFTQSIGNISPGADVHVTISYLTRLKYDDGSYEFVFPMVVGPRYIPGASATGHQGGGWSPDTNHVPDASRITPPVISPGTRAGHDVSIAVTLDGGVPIQHLRSPSHAIEAERTGPASAVVRLRNASEIPNRDFILRYDVAGPAIVEGLLTHTGNASSPLAAMSTSRMSVRTDGYFTLVIQPPERFPDSDVTPKELVFVIDSSGSMSGFPIEKSKRLIDHAIDGLYPGDTFNVIKFSGDTAVLFDEPVYPTAENVRRAREFVNSNWGGGGTEMMKAIRAALAPSDSADHVRIVVFLTDGYVGNDMEIISEIQKHPNARVFAYGIGSSVNRFLLDKMAEAGRGAVEYVSHQQDEKEAEAAAHKLYERLRAPLLTDIFLDFGSLPVADVYPRHIPDLFSAMPVIITGRYTAPAKGSIRVTAQRAGNRYTREIAVTFPGREQDNQALASLWARGKIDELMSQDWAGLQQGTMRDDLRQQITKLGLDYRLMTQFTSFVAVEEQVTTDGGRPKRIQVPVELPEGVRYEAGWSGGGWKDMRIPSALPMSSQAVGVVAGVPGGVPAGQVGGILRSFAAVDAASRRAGAANSSGVGGGYGGPTYHTGAGLKSKGTGTESAGTKQGRPKPLRLIDTKVDSRLVAAYDCWRAQPDKSKARSTCKIASDRVLVSLVIAQNSAGVQDQLKAIGFRPLSARARKGQLVGYIQLEQLAALAENNLVRFITSATSQDSAGIARGSAEQDVAR